jgi:ABC-type phosphate/phosphonate transport system substrate-binding protein
MEERKDNQNLSKSLKFLEEQATFTKAIIITGLIISASVLYLTFNVNYDECEDKNNCLIVAFEVKDTYLIWDKNPQHLADKLHILTGMDVEIYPVSNSGAAIEAVDKGNADLAFLDGAAAWLAWEVYNLEVLAAEQKADGRVYYNATAWVKSDSDMAEAYLDDDESTDPFALMEGKISCHTGWLKSAGMLIPMGYLIGNGYADVIGNPNEIESLRDTVTNFFSEESSIPEGGTQYSSYKGALRCLSDGTGDVALVKDSVINSYCTGSSAESWCLEEDEYVMLPAFGQAPSHPAVYNPEYMNSEKITLIQDALVALNDDNDGTQILKDLLNTDGMVITDAQTHLGSYGEAVSNVPGIQAFFS